ncbi:MAG: SMC-Scp complex subunit ScpB [Thermoguttaceae bacterium]|nr:SMC-Scp complex subunit ScpB [Thermoguttaceae bacterium]
MRPVRPIITDFEEVVLPEDDRQQTSQDAGADDLSSMFQRLMNKPGDAASEGGNASSQGSSIPSDVQTGEPNSQPNQPEASEPMETHTESVAAAALQDDGECPVSAESIFEAILFVGNAENDGFISTEDVCALMPGVTEEDVAAVAEKIAQRWKEDARPYYLESRDGIQWRVQLDPLFEPVRDGFYTPTRESELPQSAKNVLALVAYMQPLTAQEVGKKLGVDRPASILNLLVKRNLIQVEQRITDNKKVNLYRTTDRFLELYNLDSLDDLPTIDDV